jgi:ABC-type transport system substrate-binding protein
VLDWPGQRAKWEEQETWHVSTTYYLSQVIFNPDAMASFWHCDSASSERGFYCNEEMDAAFEAASKGITYEDRYAAFEEVQRIYYEDLPNLKIADVFAAEAIACNIKGWQNWYRAANRPWGMWRED